MPGPAADRRLRTARRLGARAPIIFVVLSLTVLVLVPVATEAYRDDIRDEVREIGEPARVLTTELGIAYAREAIAYRNHLTTGDAAYLQRYAALRAQPPEILERLAPLVRRLGPGPERVLPVVLRSQAAWHAAPDSLLAGTMTRGELIDRTARQQQHFDTTIAAVEDLYRAILADIDTRRAQLARIERFQVAASSVLAVLALISALIVVRLDRGRRRLVQQLRVQRRRAERHARDEAALRRAAAAVVEPLTSDRVLDQIAEGALMAAEAAGSVVLRIHGAELRVEATAGHPTPRVGQRMRYSGSAAATALEHGEPLAVRRVRDAEHRVLPDAVPGCDDCPGLVVPLSAAGEAIGALVLLRSPGAGPFDREAIGHARIFGRLASLAFRRAALFDQAERMRDEVQHALTAQARFARGFSHDIKNELAVADGNMELLEDGLAGKVPEPQAERVRRGRSALASALTLIDDLLTAARERAERVEMRRRPTELRELAAEIVEQYRARADAAGLELRIALPDVMPVIDSDPTRIRQILGNLLSNAVKYTPAGGRIRVRAGTAPAEPAAGGDARVFIAVRDTGPGIPPDKREAIFEEFVRVHPGEAGGAGVGLAISRQLARALGGDLTVRSRPGRGSTFTLWLPIAEARRAAA